jgi:GPH family glycoside/pentoside/hexuronide:cation symporter
MNDILPPQRPAMTLPIKMAYGFGTVAFGVKTQLMGLLLLYYNQIVGLPPHWVSMGLAVTVFFDALWDPMVGQVSDNWQSKWGRRHPFMYFSALPAAVTLVALFNPPAGWSDPALTAYMVLMVTAAKATISLYEVPAAALTPELAPAYHDRTQLLTWRYFFGIFAASGAGVMGFAVFLKDTVGPSGEKIRGQLNPAGYSPYALVVGVLMVLSILVACIATQRFIPFLHRPVVRRITFLETAKEMVVTMSNRNFLIVSLSALFVGIGAGMTAGLGVYFQTYFWGLGSGNLAFIVAGPMLGSLLALALAPVLSRRLGKRRAGVALMGMGLGLALLPVSLRLLGVIPVALNGTKTLTTLLLAERTLASACGTAAAILTASMIADVVEESQLSTGRRSEGLLLSADNVLQKIAGSVASIIPGFMLLWVGLPEKAKPESLDPSIMTNLALMYLPTTAVFGGLAIGALILYRLDQATHEANLAKLQAVEEARSA